MCGEIVWVNRQNVCVGVHSNRQALSIRRDQADDGEDRARAAWGTSRVPDKLSCVCRSATAIVYAFYVACTLLYPLLGDFMENPWKRTEVPWKSHGSTVIP